MVVKERLAANNLVLPPPERVGRPRTCAPGMAHDLWVKVP